MMSLFKMKPCLAAAWRLVALGAAVLCGCSNSASPYEALDSEDENLLVVKASGRTALLGSDSDDAKSSEKPEMAVSFDYDFKIGRHEVTRGEYLEMVSSGLGPEGWKSSFADSRDSLNYPVSDVTYYDAVLFANAMSKRSNLDTVYAYSSAVFDSEGNCTELKKLESRLEVAAYRLPTEAEWMLVARENWNPSESWNAENSSGFVHEVCSFGGASAQPNTPCDMAGNVMEWVNDWLVPFTEEKVRNYAGGAEENFLAERVLKGGSYKNSASAMQIYSRGDVYTVTSSTKSQYVGFRLAFGSVLPEPYFGGNSRDQSGEAFLLKDFSSVRNMMGSNQVKLVFREDIGGNLAVVDYSSVDEKVAVIYDTMQVYHPEISPDGKYVAFCTGLEGVSTKSSLYVRELNLLGMNPVKLDVESASIPRWRVLSNGDTVIVYVSQSGNNKEDGKFFKESTWQVPFAGGTFGTPEKLFDGAYHGGISDDGRLAVTGSRLLRARLENSEMSFAKDTVWYGGEQACNVSLSRDGSKRTMFLDFGGKTGREFTGTSYGTHEMLLIADSVGNLQRGLPAPAGFSYDHSEWALPKSADKAVVTLANANGRHVAISVVDLDDGRAEGVVAGDELMHPCLWVQKPSAQFESSGLDKDSAGVYLLSSSDVRVRIMRSKMPIFWKYRESAEVVVIGSSRTFSGVDPRFILSRPAINLSYSAQDLLSVDFFAKNYIFPLMPKLKYFVVALDYDRWGTYEEDNSRLFDDIPGYEYDKNHGYWKADVPAEMAEASANAPGVDYTEDFLYSYHEGLYYSTTVGWGGGEPAVDGFVDWFSESKDNYQKNVKMLKNILENAQKVGVTVVGVVFPQSPRYLENGVWGRYGLRLPDAEKIEAEMKSLQKIYPNFVVLDEYNNGKNEFVYTDFANEDHLGLEGATKVGLHLDSLLLRLDENP